jgi:hypothetical protein
VKIGPLLFQNAAGFFFNACMWAAGTSACACSMPADYKGPETNFELVEQADVIIVGTLVKSVGKDEYDLKILVKPNLKLKGKSLPKAVYIQGILSDRLIEIDGKKLKIKAKKSEPLDLWRPHPEVWMGGCSRSTFNKGAQLLLFFKQNGRELEWFDPAFTRGSEDVTGPDALWVRAVKVYARIAQLPKSAQRLALSKEMEALRNKSAFERDENSLLADDIERQLLGVAPVTDFDLLPKSGRPVEWANNIVNQMYFAVPAPQEIKDAPENSYRKWTWVWIGQGLLTVLAFVGGWIVKGKRKAIEGQAKP